MLSKEKECKQPAIEVIKTGLFKKTCYLRIDPWPNTIVEHRLLDERYFWNPRSKKFSRID